MPQLDFFWWGMSFLSCWFFFIFLYIYLMNLKLLLLGKEFSLISKAFSKVFSFSWLW